MIFQVFGHEGEHHKVRSAVVQYMADHSDCFSPFVEDDEGFEKYVTRMQKVNLHFLLDQPGRTAPDHANTCT